MKSLCLTNFAPRADLLLGTIDEEGQVTNSVDLIVAHAKEAYFELRTSQKALLATVSPEVCVRLQSHQ